MLQALYQAVLFLFGHLKALFFWLWGLIWEYVAWAWDGLLSLLPELVVTGFVEPALEYLRAANHWIPLSEGFILFGLYATFWVAAVPIRTIYNSLPIIN